jgi:hypothetical protein
MDQAYENTEHTCVPSHMLERKKTKFSKVEYLAHNHMAKKWYLKAGSSSLALNIMTPSVDLWILLHTI